MKLFNYTIKLSCILLVGLFCIIWSKPEVYRLSRGTERVDTLPFWLVFKDKAISSPVKRTVTTYAQKRRAQKGYRSDGDISEIPISNHYIKKIENTGAVLRNRFIWANAASFNIPLNVLPELRKMPFISGIYTVSTFIKTGSFGLKKRKSTPETVIGEYGTLFRALSLIEVPAAHYYLSIRNPGESPGEGQRIAFFDSGFRLDHRCFKHLLDRNAIVGMYDFVDKDSTLNDPDSVLNDSHHPLQYNDLHGSEVLSLVAAYDPPYFCGTAWGSEFLLARTEQGDRELHTEEDNWAAAVVWAESLGVDIISSSLGYRTDFEDTVVIETSDGIYDTITDYRKSDLDGKTTIVSLAARQAVDRGVLVVNASGNELDDWGDTSLSAPSDVDGVVAVGSISYEKVLSRFSSVGPTSDGRIKPDVLAPGQNVALPWIYAISDSLYDNSGNGTSYATPLIAGSLALIKQSNPEMNAEQLREKLYQYCSLPQNRSYPIGYYGKGIPDITHSCMHNDDEILIYASDETYRPLSGITITDENDTYLGKTDPNGYALFRLGNDRHDTVHVTVNGKKRAVFIKEYPFHKNIHPCTLVVTLYDNTERLLTNTGVKVEYLDETIITETNGEGKITVDDYFPSPTLFTISSAGYSSDTLHCSFSDRMPVQRNMHFSIASKKNVLVYPTLLRRRDNGRLTIKCLSNAESTNNSLLDVSIRSLNGSLIWHQTIDISNMFPEIQWNGRTKHGGLIAPGSYFVTISFNSHVYREKIIIAE